MLALIAALLCVTRVAASRKSRLPVTVVTETILCGARGLADALLRNKGLRAKSGALERTGKRSQILSQRALQSRIRSAH